MLQLETRDFRIWNVRPAPRGGCCAPLLHLVGSELAEQCLREEVRVNAGVLLALTLAAFWELLSFRLL